MYVIDRCPCCGCRESRAWPALVAPFLADYVLHGPVRACRLMECERCGCRYFDLRLDGDEVRRLYADYRGPSYFATRHRHEFWYTRAFNRGLGADPVALAKRQRELGRFLREHLDAGGLGRVLDYGGDSGQLLAEGPGRQREVYDLSDAPAVSGVTKVSRDQDLARGGYDLVVLSHVLEHVSEPADLLREVRGLLPPHGGWVYVEVPWERTHMALAGTGRATRVWQGVLARMPRVLRVVDLYSTGVRVKLDRMPPLGFPKLHEHLNFFTPEAFAALFDRAGYDLRACERAPMLGDATGPDVLRCLAFARRASPAASNRKARTDR